MKLLSEKGEIYLRDKFIWPRLIKDVLRKTFNVSIIDEGPNYIKFRIIRLARLYGFPFIWPQASIEIWIKNENDKLIYKFFGQVCPIEQCSSDQWGTDQWGTVTMGDGHRKTSNLT